MFLVMQLNVTKLKLCIAGGRGSNQELSLFLLVENCSIHADLAYELVFMTYKFHRNLLFCFPKIFEYVVMQ